MTSSTANAFNSAVCKFVGELSAHHMKGGLIARVLAFVGNYHAVSKHGSVSKRVGDFPKSRMLVAKLTIPPSVGQG